MNQSSPPLPPREAYQRRREEYRGQRAALERRLDRLGLARLAAGGIGVIVLILVFALRWLPLGWLLLPAAALIILSAAFARLRARLAVILRAERFYEHGLERVDNTWMGKGDAGTRYQDENHLYSADLDLFGAGSLFERISTAHTREGQDRLADWLRVPADALTIQRRQAAVAELRERLDLRERLALLGQAIPGGLETESVRRWAEQPPLLPLRAGTWIVHGLTIAVGAALLAWGFLEAGLAPLIAVLIGQSIFVLWFMGRVRQVLGDVERRGNDLLELSGILGLLEAESFTAPHLGELRDSLNTRDEPPSKQIAQLVRLIDILSSRRNQLFIPVALLLMWGTRLAYSIEAWRIRCGPAVGRWFAAIAEIEALVSLAGYAFENPLDPFPEIVTGGPLLRGSGLRHPLIARGQCVANDIDLGGQLRVLVVSGSNMSGKSTWLRTIGCNAVLALAGATVAAERLTLSPLALGATLRIQDSLMAGKSRFYAEITRIQQIMEKAKGALPLLYLFDEILHGTNSHDRGLGAAAIVRALVERGAIGLLTTHDLALAHIAETLAAQAANVHFADQLVDGKMVFDYRMRPGVVRHSNAIALMRIVGLPV